MTNSVWETLGSETLEVLSGTPEEDYGNNVLTWANPTVTETLKECSVQPVGGSQIDANREAIITRYQVWVPGRHPQLNGTKRIRWMGVDYQIDGGTPYFPDPLQMGLDHHIFYMQEVSG